jgi:hypothetical protein
VTKLDWSKAKKPPRVLIAWNEDESDPAVGFRKYLAACERDGRKPKIVSLAVWQRWIESKQTERREKREATKPQRQPRKARKPRKPRKRKTSTISNKPASHAESRDLDN